MKINGKTTVVLGGGVGGVVVTNELRRRVADKHKITLVERNAEHAFAPSFLWLMVGGRKPEQVVKPLNQLLRKGVDIVGAEVTGIDISNRRLITSEESLIYDFLVLATGVELAPEFIPGLEKCAYSFYTFDEAKRLHHALSEFLGGRIVLLVSSVPYKCPGAPHEAAMLIDDYFRKRGMQDRVEIHLYTPESQPMGAAGPALGEAVKQMLTSKGISFHPLHKITSLDPKKQELEFEGKATVQFDMLIAIPPHRSPLIVREAGLTDDTGWVPVDRYTLRTDYENVYAIGDITAIDMPGHWKAGVPVKLPKAGVFAHAQAKVVASRISDEIKGRIPRDQFSGTGYCMLEAGGGKAGFAFGNFFDEPAPRMEMRNAGRIWHLAKVIFERWWLAPFGSRKSFYGFLLRLGAKVFKLPLKL